MAESVLSPEDDTFWLQRAGAIVTGTAGALDNAARRLADAMAWFWTAYAAVALVVVSGTNGVTSVGVGVAVAVPAVLIFAAYLCATFATLPIEVGFDDRVPKQIKQAHESVLRRRLQRIQWAAALAAVAALSVAVAVSLVAVTSGHEPRNATVFALSDDHTRALVGGRQDEAKQVTVRMIDPNGRQTERVVPVVDHSWDTAFLVATSGAYQVSASWTIDGVRHSVAQNLKRP